MSELETDSSCIENYIKKTLTLKSLNINCVYHLATFHISGCTDTNYEITMEHGRDSHDNLANLTYPCEQIGMSEYICQFFDLTKYICKLCH